MKITFRKSFCLAVVLLGLAGLMPSLQAADSNGTAPKDSQSLLIDMRVKRWAKEMELNTNQQAQIKTVLSEEARQVAKLDEDKSMTVSTRGAKIDEMHKATYEKIKPLLTEKQVPVFEKLTTKATKSKKPAPAANP